METKNFSNLFKEAKQVGFDPLGLIITNVNNNSSVSFQAANAPMFKHWL